MKNKRTEYKKICEHCGKEYTTTNKWQKFCSVECRGKSTQKIVTYKCEHCGKEFEVHEWDLRWRKNPPKYCSEKCYHEASRKEETRYCATCGKSFVVNPCSKKQYCCKECVNTARRKAERVATKGKNGYMYVWFSDGSGEKEHRYIMEKHLGRKLTREECVHHKDGDRSNNKLENLEIMTIGEHSRLHRLKEIEEGKELFGRKTL